MKLPVAEIMQDAFRIPWKHREDFARALLMPLIGTVALELVQYYWPQTPSISSAWVSWFFVLLNAVIFSWLAVCCHRLVLLGVKRENLERNWSGRETRFLLVVIGLYLTAMMLSMLLTPVASGFMLLLPDIDGVRSIIFLAILAPAWYVFARLSLLLPAIAVDHPYGIGRAWKQSAKNGWRLFVIVCLLPWGLSSALWAIYPSSWDAPLWSAIFAIFAALLIVFEVCALSLCYRALSEE